MGDKRVSQRSSSTQRRRNVLHDVSVLLTNDAVAFAASALFQAARAPGNQKLSPPHFGSSGMERSGMAIQFELHLESLARFA